MATDPGWIPAIANFWRYILFPTWQQRSKRVLEMPLLLWIRSMALTAPAMWAILLLVLVIIRKPDVRRHGGTVYGGIVAAVGLVCIVSIVFARSRPPAGKDTVSVASAYRARFFLGWSLCSTPVLVGFVVYFQTYQIAVYLIGVTFGVVGDVINAPSRVRLEAEQARLTAAHSTVKLLEALMLPNGQIPRPRR